MFDFPKWLETQMESKGWTQAHLAQMLGCTPSYVSYLAGGRDMPSPDNLAKLEEIFAVVPRGTLFGHKMMNKIEKIGALRVFCEDPSLLAIHGIEVMPMTGRQTPAAAKAGRNPVRNHIAEDRGKWRIMAGIVVREIGPPEARPIKY
jgi:transcriptional regulator with XRE-family HTH domain